jgi:predicted pyridoxine 5'-phosphate oxidase superfamily flavin-nucleotide-binding protein
MKRVVREQQLGYVATVCPDGTPNLSPKGTLVAWDDDHLLFADLRSPGTVRNLEHNPAVEINVVDPFARKGFRFKGTATVVTEGSLFEAAVAFYDQQGVFDAPRRIRCVVVMRVEQVRPLISPGYDRGASEERVRRQWMAYYAALQAGAEPDDHEPMEA